MATIGIVLLIACANVANLLLVRTEGRAQELAVRAAIGAGRGRLAREMLVESLLLGLLGGAAGIGFAVAALKLVLTLNPARLPRLELIAVDATSLVFTLVVSVAAGLAFGAIPVLKHAPRPPRRGAPGRRPQRERRPRPQHHPQHADDRPGGAGAGAAHRLRPDDPHLPVDAPRAAGVHRARRRCRRSGSPFPATSPRTTRRVLLMQQGLVDALASLPGVTSVSLMNGLPMTGFSSQDPIFASDHTYAARTRSRRCAASSGRCRRRSRCWARRSPPAASTTGPTSTRSATSC